MTIKDYKIFFSQLQQVILAIDGMQPDVGHEVLWVIPECICWRNSQDQKLRCRQRSSTSAELLNAVKSAFVGANCGGHQRLPTLHSESRRNGIARIGAWIVSLPRFSRRRRNRLKTADRHAKKELKKRVRGVRTIERDLTDTDNPITEVIQDYCQAVRAALTEDGRPPIEASGLRLEQRSLCD